jgi:hypothetical protein
MRLTPLPMLFVVAGCSGRLAVHVGAADGSVDVVFEAGDARDEENDVTSSLDGADSAAEEPGSAEPSNDEDVAEELIVEAGVDGDADGPGDASDADVRVGSFTIDPNRELTTTEGGGQATFTIVLDSMPLGSVILPLMSSRPDEGTVVPTTLSFTSADWNVPQVVTVTGVDDSLCDGNQPYMIMTGKVVSADPAYDGLDPPDVRVTNVDNEGGGFTINPSKLTTTEKGGAASFTVVLNCQPVAGVTIPITSTNPAEGRVEPDVIVFTHENWNRPATVVVTGVDDAVRDGDQVYKVRVGPTMSSDPKFVGLQNSVSVTNIDDD